jgi:hypothetical protein
MPAPVFNVQKPPPLLDEDRGFLMADVPADVFKIIPGRGFVKLQGKIFAAQRAAPAAGALYRSLHPLPSVHYQKLMYLGGANVYETYHCIQTQGRPAGRPY